MFIKRIISIIICFVVFSSKLSAQFVYGTTGLLHMPIADMQNDKTFMVGGSFLHNKATPKQWWYNTFNYYLNITLLPFMEISYTMTLNKAVDHDYYGNPITYWEEEDLGRFVNQDRMFSVRLRVIKEGQWWKCMPAVVLGSNDVLTGAASGGQFSSDEQSYTGNGYWNRYYIAFTKHFVWKTVAEVGIHAVYIYNRRTDFRYNGPGLGINLRFALPVSSAWQKALSGLNLMAEYDSRTINFGCCYTFGKDYINVVGELYQCKYPSVGIYLKVHLR